MANDALAQSGIDLGLPQQTDYDAGYAAVTATERDRSFSTELADRNRHPDTEALMAAIARIEAALGGDAPAKRSTRLPDISAAAERLADIAFGLRERGADGTLCDALDAAVREICAACSGDVKTHETEDQATLTIPDRTLPKRLAKLQTTLWPRMRRCRLNPSTCRCRTAKSLPRQPPHLPCR